jgi:hypothetical protein
MRPEDAQLLMAQAGAVDAHADAALTEATAALLPPPADPAAAANEWLFVPELLAMVICTALPECAPAYTPEANMRVAEKLAIVAEKRGWNVGGTPEIALGIACLGFGAPAFMAIQNRKRLALPENDTGSPPMGPDHGG